MTYDVGLCHPNDITNLILKSSGWLSYSHYLRMTYGHCKMSSGWLAILPYLIRMTKRHLNPKSSGWVRTWPYPIRMTYGRCIMSSGWLSWRWYLIRVGYGNVIISSGWDTLPILSHPDEITNFLIFHNTLWPFSASIILCTAPHFFFVDEIQKTWHRDRDFGFKCYSPLKNSTDYYWCEPTSGFKWAKTMPFKSSLFSRFKL